MCTCASPLMAPLARRLAQRQPANCCCRRPACHRARRRSRSAWRSSLPSRRRNAAGWYSGRAPPLPSHCSCRSRDRTPTSVYRHALVSAVCRRCVTRRHGTPAPASPQAAAQGTAQGGALERGRNDSAVRVSSVRWLKLSEARHAWLRARLSRLLHRANEQAGWRFEPQATAPLAPAVPARHTTGLHAGGSVSALAAPRATFFFAAPSRPAAWTARPRLKLERVALPGPTMGLPLDLTPAV